MNPKEDLHACVQIVPRETDYIAGINSPLPFESRLPGRDWTPYLPNFDAQKLNGLETDACVPFSAVESIETQIDFLKKTGQLPQPHIDALTKLGFFNDDGTFHASERFMAKVDGTTQQGTSLTAPWDAVRKYGLLPYIDWQFDASIDTWDEFYAPIPQALLDKAKQFLTYFDVSYELIANGWPSGTPIALIQQHLQQAPLCIGGPVCQPWNQDTVPTCSSESADHSTMIYKLDDYTRILDHYAPFLKSFHTDYNIPYIIKGIVTVKALPVAPIPTDIAPTQQNVNILVQIVSLYQKLLSLLKGRQISASTPMVKSWYQSKTVWFNGLTIVIAVATFFGFTPDQALFTNVTNFLIAFAPVANIALRFLTKKPIASPITQ